MVKKALILIICFAVLHTSAGVNTSVGVNGSLGITNMSGVKDDDTDTNGAFRGSFGFMSIFAIGNFLIYPAIIIAWMGTTKRHTLPGPRAVTSTEATEKVSLGYLRVPVLVGYEFPLSGNIKPRVLLGPSFNFNISGKDDASGFGTWDGEHDIGNLKGLDFGAMYGAGASIPIGKVTLGADFFFSHSFSTAFTDVSAEELANDTDEELWTKINPVTYERTTEAVDYKNRGFFLQVSATMPIGR